MEEVEGRYIGCKLYSCFLKSERDLDLQEIEREGEERRDSDG